MKIETNNQEVRYRIKVAEGLFRNQYFVSFDSGSELPIFTSRAEKAREFSLKCMDNIIEREEDSILFNIHYLKSLGIKAVLEKVYLKGGEVK